MQTCFHLDAMLNHVQKTIGFGKNALICFDQHSVLVEQRYGFQQITIAEGRDWSTVYQLEALNGKFDIANPANAELNVCRHIRSIFTEATLNPRLRVANVQLGLSDRKFVEVSLIDKRLNSLNELIT